MENLKKTLILIAVTLYVLSPLDFMPGLLFDDLIVIIFGIWQIKGTAPKMIEQK